MTRVQLMQRLRRVLERLDEAHGVGQLGPGEAARLRSLRDPARRLLAQLESAPWPSSAWWRSEDPGSDDVARLARLERAVVTARTPPRT